MFNLFKKKDYVLRSELSLLDMNNDWVAEKVFVTQYIRNLEKHAYDQLWKLEAEILRLRHILIESGIIEQADIADVELDGVGYTINSIDDTEEED